MDVRTILLVDRKKIQPETLFRIEEFLASSDDHIVIPVDRSELEGIQEFRVSREDVNLLRKGYEEGAATAGAAPTHEIDVEGEIGDILERSDEPAGAKRGGKRSTKGRKTR